jgi:hypothetical protein
MALLEFFGTFPKAGRGNAKKIDAFHRRFTQAIVVNGGFAT